MVTGLKQDGNINKHRNTWPQEPNNQKKREDWLELASRVIIYYTRSPVIMTGSEQSY